MLVAGCYVAAVIAAYTLTRVRAIYGLGALVFATPFTATVAFTYTTVTLPKAILLSVCVALISRGSARISGLRREPIMAATICLIVATALSDIGALHHDAVVREVLKAGFYALTLFVASWCYRSDPDALLLLRIVAMLTGIVSIAALSQEWTGAPSVFLSAHGIVPRIAGPLEGPNQLAGFFDVALSWLLAQALFAYAARERIVQTALALGYIALFLTFSRGGIFASTVTAGALLVLENAFASVAARIWLTASVLGLALDLGLARGGGHLFSITDSGDTGALGHRSELWRAAIFFWRRHSLTGIGAGNYERELSIAGYPKLHDHANSLYLQSLAEGGIVLFSAVAALYVAIAAAFMRNVHSKPLAAGALAATFAFAVHQSVDYLVFYPKVAGLWWVFLGVALADRMGNGESLPKRQR